MVSLIAERRNELVTLCQRFRVRRLEIFGSAAGGGTFDPRRSDLDFLVAFADLSPTERFDTFFGLHDALARLFQRPIDLVEDGAPRNPYFLRRLNESRTLVYAA